MIFDAKTMQILTEDNLELFEPAFLARDFEESDAVCCIMLSPANGRIGQKCRDRLANSNNQELHLFLKQFDALTAMLADETSPDMSRLIENENLVRLIFIAQNQKEKLEDFCKQLEKQSSASAQVDPPSRETTPYESPCKFASAIGRLECLSVLELYQAKEDDRYEDEYHVLSALHLAAKNGHKEVVAFLLEKSPERLNDVTYYEGIDYTALYFAVEYGHKDVVALLLEKGADGADEYYTLRLAAQNGHKEVVALLLANGASLEGECGASALHDAAENGHKEVVVFLLENGASLQDKDVDGWTALHVAAHNGHKEVVALLLQNGASLQDKEVDGWTALHLAAQNGHKEVVALLLQNGASLQDKTNEGWTALHVAAHNGHKEVVALLLQNGASLQDKTKKGLTALHLAYQAEEDGCINLIIEFMQSHPTPLPIEFVKGEVNFLVENEAEFELEPLRKALKIYSLLENFAETSTSEIMSNLNETQGLHFNFITQEGNSLYHLIGELSFDYPKEMREILTVLKERHHPNPYLKNTLNQDVFERLEQLNGHVLPEFFLCESHRHLHALLSEINLEVLRKVCLHGYRLHSRVGMRCQLHNKTEVSLEPQELVKVLEDDIVTLIDELNSHNNYYPVGLLNKLNALVQSHAPDVTRVQLHPFELSREETKNFFRFILNLQTIYSLIIWERADAPTREHLRLEAKEYIQVSTETYENIFNARPEPQAASSVTMGGFFNKKRRTSEASGPEAKYRVTPRKIPDPQCP